MNIQLKLIHGCTLLLLLTACLLSYADEFSISNYVISNQNSANSRLVDIKIGWVTIDLTSLDPNLTNDQRITASNSREEYILNVNDFRNMVRFYYDFTSASTNDGSEAIRQMSQFLTRIFRLNAININRNNITQIQRDNMDFFYRINLSNDRQASSNNNYGKKRCRRTAQRNNAGSANPTIGFDDFYSDPNNNLSCISNTGLALLLGSFLEPWIQTDVQVVNNPLAIINDHLALTQQAFFNRVFQRVLSSANLPSTSTSAESTSRSSHEYDPFAFATTEDIIQFLNSTGANRDFVFATLLRSLSIGFSLHLIHHNVFSRERPSTPENINRNYPAADTMQIVFWGYLRAYLQSRGVNLPVNCSFDSNCMRQMASDSQQLSRDFWANLALIYKMLAQEDPNGLFARLAGTDAPDAAPPEAPAMQQAVANPNANQPDEAREIIKQLSRLNLQLNDRLNELRNSGQASSEESSSKECVVCLQEKTRVALNPCGHTVACNDCATRILNGNGNCPMCRAKIQSIIHLFHN